MNQSIWKRMMAGILLLLILIGLDQFTKHLAVLYLQQRPDAVLIPGVFRLTYVENYGAAFGTMENRRLFLLAVNLVLMLYIFLVYRKLAAAEGHRLMRFCCISILAGGIGNMIDRLVRGYVVDFFYFQLIHFPVFNVADCYITCAVALLVISMFTIYKEEDMELLIPFGKDKNNDADGNKL